MHSDRTFKKWLLRFSLLLACMLGIMGFFNYLVDPLWCFCHGYHPNEYSIAIDERQQKTNFLTFCNSARYDALILGNSRTALINQNDFSGMRAFNYSQPDMTAYEYGEYIEYFKRTIGTPRVIILGLSFTNTVGGVMYNSEKPAHYIAMANSPFYRFKFLFTADTLRYSWDNVRIPHFIDGDNHWVAHQYYDHANVKMVIPPNDKAAVYIKMIEDNLNDLAKTYGSGYRYGEELKGALRKVRDDNPGSRFLVFTNPVTERYYCTLVRLGRLPEYERWLREMVEVFGQVWHFEYPHSIARNPVNFCDHSHFYPLVGTLLVHRVTGVPDPGIPEDFGMLLTPSTIDQGLARIRASSAVCCQEAACDEK